MVKAILMGIVVMLLTVLMDRSLMGEDFIKTCKDEDGKKYTKFNGAGFDDSTTWVRAISYGIVVGVVAFLATLKWWLASICLLPVLGLMLQYAWWWGRAGTGKLKALIWFLLIQCVLQSVAAIAVRKIVGFNQLYGCVAQILPAVIGGLSIGSAIVGTCRRCDKKVLATIFLWLTWIGVVLSVAGGIYPLIGNINLGAMRTQVVMTEETTSPEVISTPEPTPAPEPTATPTPTPGPTVTPTPANQYGWYGQQPGNGQLVEWWTFYNLTIQNDGLLNDNDFGPNPYREGWWTNEYVNEMLTRIWKDPVLGAADIAYFDHIAGTNISSVKYDKDPQKWLDNINARAVEFVRDRDMYYRVVEEFIRAIDNRDIVLAVEIKLRSDVKNLMYMDSNNTVNLGSYGGYGYGNYGYGGYGGYGYNGYGGYGSYTIKMPKVIMKSHNEQAYFLVFTVKNGNNTGEALYKLACGYQPPIEKGGTGGINPGGNIGGGSGPGSGPSSQYHKDPTQGTDVGGNIESGPGTFTGTGVGSWYSAAEELYSSTDGTYSDYQAAIQTDASAGGTSHAGGTPSTPTAATPAGADKDDNAGSGTGYGGIDVGTTVSAPATDASTGQAITTEAAGAWGGPSD